MGRWTRFSCEFRGLAFSELKKSYRKDCRLIQELASRGVHVITILFSGRPLYVIPQINQSAAFVAGFLPGTEARGVTAVLFGDQPFTGKLPFSWPNTKHDFTVMARTQQPLFERGYGWASGQDQQIPGLNEDSLPEDTKTSGNTAEPTTLEVFGKASDDEHVLRLSDPTKWEGLEVSSNGSTSLQNLRSQPIDFQMQQDGRRIEFLGGAAQVYAQTQDQQGIDRQRLLNAVLQFTIRVVQLSTSLPTT